ncbi:MAG: mechanosensitive ion channel [Gammaproteobacteria bacterium]|nr:mechanosensitive ion channel [Gammaproteobacteria bacterium]MBP9728818.1 mechanosensitive ion channel [Gammaproteobacteria bacterium]
MDLSMPELNTMLSHVFAFLKGLDILLVFKVASSMFLGVMFTLHLRRKIGNASEKHLSAHHSQLVRRTVFYAGIALAIIVPLNVFGINIKGLMDVAGIAATIITAAFAFAAQTSISNFLSGVFLLAEKPFQVGDYIELNGRLGEILAIDLLSVKMRTKSNILVRIPNELLLKSQFDNVSRFPIRRCDVQFKVAFNEDLAKVKKILLGVAAQNALCLVSPAPELSVLRLNDTAVSLQFAVWGTQSTFSSLETNIQIDIQSAFKQHNIQLPSVPTVVLESV